jgi:hypothetical protein
MMMMLMMNTKWRRRTRGDEGGAGVRMVMVIKKATTTRTTTTVVVVVVMMVARDGGDRDGWLQRREGAGGGGDHVNVQSSRRVVPLAFQQHQRRLAYAVYAHTYTPCVAFALTCLTGANTNRAEQKRSYPGPVVVIWGTNERPARVRRRGSRPPLLRAAGAVSEANCCSNQQSSTRKAQIQKIRCCC